MESDTLEKIQQTPTPALRSMLKWQKALEAAYDGDSQELRDQIRQGVKALQDELERRSLTEPEKIIVIICDQCQTIIDSGDKILTPQMLNLPEIQRRLAIVEAKCQACMKEEHKLKP